MAASLKFYNKERYPHGIDIDIGPMALGGSAEWEVAQRVGGLSELLGNLYKHLGEAFEAGGPAAEHATFELPQMKWMGADLKDLMAYFHGLSPQQIQSEGFKIPSYILDISRENPERGVQEFSPYQLKGMLDYYHKYATNLGSELEEIMKQQFGTH